MKRKRYNIGHDKGCHIYAYKILGFYQANYCIGQIIDTRVTGIGKTLKIAVASLWNAK